MAEVYVGRHVGPDGTFGPMVAVKRLLPHLVSDPAIVQMFLNEAKITAQIDHPNVVRILDLGHENGEPYIAMELLEGRSFSELRQQAAHLAQRVPLGITLKVLADACRGLDAAHRAVDEQGRFLRIVHRDFTPDNIHVGVSGDIKVIDFGIAKARNVGSMTEPGTLKGKFFYMSPEMIAGRPVDHRADLFAAGVMLYEQLCGRRPFTGSGPDQVLARIAEGQPRRPTEFDPSVPPALEAICLMALSREPDKRFASLNEFIKAIESLAVVATNVDVGNYVSKIFPAEEDPKRQTLRKARAADPSVPAMHSPATGVPIAEPKPGGAPEIPKTPAGHKRRRWPLIVGGLILSFAAGGGLAYWRLIPGPTPAKRLSEAQPAADAAARTQLLEPLGDDPRTTSTQFKKAGNLLLASGANEAVLKLAGKFSSRFPQEVAAPLLEAKASIRLHLGKRAQAAIEKAAAMIPADTEPDLLLAELREAQGDLPGAIEAVNRALKKRPTSTSLAARRGYLLSQSGRLDEAAEVLSAVLQKRFDPDAASELGFVRLRQNEAGDALTLVKRALKKEPRLGKAHFYLGAILSQQGDSKGAEKSYREADDLSPDDPRALAALCELHARSGHTNEVGEIKQLIATRFPREATALQARCSP